MGRGRHRGVELRGAAVFDKRVGGGWSSTRTENRGDSRPVHAVRLPESCLLGRRGETMQAPPSRARHLSGHRLFLKRSELGIQPLHQEPKDSPEGLRLNLGCGSKRVPGYVGVDIGEGSAVDVRMDVMDYLRSLAPHSVQQIYSAHFLEHVEARDLRPMLLEFDRVLRPGGGIQVIVPHYSNPYFYSDPTHRMFFGVHTFSYFCDRSCLRRRVPRYTEIPGWSLLDVKLYFKPYAKLKLFGIKIPLIAAWLNWGINKRLRAIEIFERHFCGLWSIFEVTYRIEKRAP